MSSCEQGPDRPRFRLISSTEMRLIEKLPAARLEGQFVEWVRQSKSMSKLDYVRWSSFDMAKAMVSKTCGSSLSVSKNGCPTTCGLIAPYVVGAMR